MDYRSYEFVSKNPKTPEYAVHILNQHIKQWYAERGYPDPENKYRYNQLLPHGDKISWVTSLYRKNPGADWEWNNDDDYLVMSTAWPPDKAIFFDYEEEVWSLATPSTDLPGAWVAQDKNIVVMDANTFPEDLIPAMQGPELTFAALAAAVKAEILQAQVYTMIQERIDHAKVAHRLP